MRRDLRTFARRVIEKEPVVSIIVAFVGRGEVLVKGRKERLESRTVARRWREIWEGGLAEFLTMKVQ